MGLFTQGNDGLFKTQSTFGPHGHLSQPGLQWAVPLESVLAYLAPVRDGM